MKKFFDQLSQAAAQMAQDLEHTFAGNTQVGIELPVASCAPGDTVRGTAWVAAGDREVTVTLYRVHLRVRAVQPVTVVAPSHAHVDHAALHHAHHHHLDRVIHDVVPPRVLGDRFAVPARSRREAAFELVVPAGVPPSAPGQYDYVLTAWAVVQGQLIDSVYELPLWISPAAAAAASAAPGPRAPEWIRPGASAVAPDGEGTAQVLVVEVRGAVTLVQWPDARPATWVRTDSLRPV